MKGTNRIDVNKATMNQIAQDWVDRTFAGQTLEVTDVKGEDYSEEFTITIQEKSVQQELPLK